MAVTAPLDHLAGDGQSATLGRKAWSGSVTVNATPQVVVNLPASASGPECAIPLAFWQRLIHRQHRLEHRFCAEISSTSYNCATIDGDGDGIPDGWESLYGFNPNDPADAGQDFDGDGMTNSQEYIAGTDPNQRREHFPNHILRARGKRRRRRAYLSRVLTGGFIASRTTTTSPIRMAGRRCKTTSSAPDRRRADQRSGGRNDEAILSRSSPKL